ncbi:MAG: aldose epimerase family protein, partial [bacterium]
MSIKIISQNNGMDVIELANEHLIVRITNFGATILNIYTRDCEGRMVDVVMGYKTLEEYDMNDAYLGALVGRVANRIKNGEFTLHGTTYHLPINSGPNSLHGGKRGFSFRLFDYQPGEDEIIFRYHAKDGEEGYPGNLDLTAVYALEGTSLTLTYKATTDQDTLINITNHSYFNLEGHCTSIDNHILQIDAGHFAPIDEDGCVTGELREVEGTPFDFRKPAYIGDMIHKTDRQLTLGKGIDHPFILDCQNRQIFLYSERSGIALTVKT